jgi:hypothetical protein
LQKFMVSQQGYGRGQALSNAGSSRRSGGEC